MSNFNAVNGMEDGDMKSKSSLSRKVYKLVMIQPFLVIALLLTLIEAAWADPYELVMSNDKELCKSMLGLYNTDMNTYGRIDYDSHDIFSRIEWKNLDDLDHPIGISNLRANFDINNDGKNETVVKFSVLVGSAVDGDHLDIYPGDSEIFSKDATGKRGRLLDTPNTLFSGGNNYTYYLNQVPQLLQEKILAYKFKQLRKRKDLKDENDEKIRRSISKAYIAGAFVLQPFIWHGTTYISITSKNPEWIVVGQYKQAEEVNEVCYLYDKSHRFINY